MKTLDEVIAELEDEGVFADALHYLKEYREEDKKLGAAINEACDVEMKYCRLVEELERNEPLTWDELHEMEGKPVWIWISPRVKNTPGSGHWAIVYRFNPIGGNKNLFEMQMENGSRYKRKYQGDLWQAYRKERK